MKKTIDFRKLISFAGVAAATLLVTDLARAQAPPAAASVSAEQLTFDLPAQPLTKAALLFSEQAGVQLVFGAQVAEGLRSNAVQGRYSVADALNRLLAGTGLEWRYLNAHTITIEPPLPASASGAHILGAVQVEGVQTNDTNGFADLNGFGASAGANGSSDVTATENTHSFTTNGSSVASKTPQSLQEGAQSVSVITQERIQQQNLTDITSALNYTPGITLDQTTATHTSFYSRGFTIGTFVVDGGAPMSYNFGGQDSLTPDLSEYDHIEVLRGSDGLFGGQGNPGGVISLERKRPLDHERLTVDAQTGTWRFNREEVDATGPIAFDGHLRARFDAVYQSNNFFYDVAHFTKTHLYGVVEADLGPDTLVRFGGSRQVTANPGYNAYGLGRYSNGDSLGLPASTCLCAPWNSEDTESWEAFLALEHRFDDHWRVKLDATRTHQDVSGISDEFGGSVQPGTTTGPSFSSISGIAARTTKNALNVTLSGGMMLFGFEQRLVVGLDYSLSSEPVTAPLTFTAGTPIDVFDFNPASTLPEPPHPPLITGSDFFEQEQSGGYLNLMLQPLANVHLSGGFRYSNERDVSDTASSGFGVVLFSSNTRNRDYGVITPTATASYDLTHSTSLYASYSDIYSDQSSFLTTTGQPLPAINGYTYETGVKGRFRDGKLNASLALYYSNQNNVAQPAGVAAPAGLVGNCCYVNTGRNEADGVETEVSGELTPGWQIQGGYTYNHNWRPQASGTEPFNTQQPTHQAKIWTSYALPGWFTGWSVGGGFRLESTRYTVGVVCNLPVDPTGFCLGGTDVPFNFKQDLYTVTDLRVAYRLNEHWQASLNVTNVGDTRYYSTTNPSTASTVSGNFYGQPRALMLNVRASY
jgi:outer membrane receptor for ferric coprogen and ferric-rhodotorulic acid